MKKAPTQHVWTSWSGNVRFTPERVFTPSDEAGLQQVIQDAHARGGTVRVVGSRHSCSDVYVTYDTLVSMERLSGLVRADTDACTAAFLPGTTVEQAGTALMPHDLAMENMGHIDQQTLAGAISTGTHGAGKRLPNLSAQLIGVRLVDGTGTIRVFDEDNHPDTMQALRVSLGALGVFTEVTLRLLPQYRLVRKQYRASLHDCLIHLHDLMDTHRNFLFYWYPRRDDVTVRTWDEDDRDVPDLPFGELYKTARGYAKDVLPSEQELRFNELEYSVSLEDAVACFLDIRARIKAKHRKDVGWRVLFRPVRGDDSWLSNSYGKPAVVAITIHQNATLPYQPYFDDIETIFRAYGGRPHWGKKHSLRAADLRTLYPKWDAFQQLRSQLDPEGVLLNDHLKTLFTDDE
ncbi:D-arabinono-1,4-lactone oxidase [Parapedobacter composti]|uniref:D-arabinono-1,4-lactone oxidase n=1 Tax=Parapedobacter composti TaxID=623281 RepID=UPI00147BEC71|nr:D-arabinono-1,4-lactone oxidase [Parapedobacter composti]